ncbi:proline-rich receptor-like protein kinase PERK4 [Benincasa hispida]|uniref:proline-rich receptor-like protein kinase PERK4 n=1 Tax=Benincasa hispida TaxID=102211 RepID=UPI0019013708|nr:proline-rich receptor-like protein kinase PERK4 [Benincasa hispida]
MDSNYDESAPGPDSPSLPADPPLDSSSSSSPDPPSSSPPSPPSPDPDSNFSPPPPPENDGSSNDSSPPPKDSPSPKSSKDKLDKPSDSKKSPSAPKEGSPRSAPLNSHSPPSRSSSSADALPAPGQTEGKASPKSSARQQSSEADSSPSEINPGVIIGVAVGVGVLIIVLISVVALCTKKKKRKGDPVQYYGDHGRGPRGGDYYNSSQQQNWHNNGMQGPGTDQFGRQPPSASLAGSGWPMSGGDNMTTGSSYTGPPLPPPSPSIAFGFNKSTFTYDELAAATGGFAHANLLGQGGFGYVHKGVLPNGKEVAVKSLKVGSGQGEREFMAEVEIISRVHHRHLVSLVGYCIASGQRMLVYEFVPNNTLEHHLHGKGLPVMDWPTRLRIAIGSAKGLAYLHEDCHPKIIHRDIKSANILIDANFEAMVADFGLAKLSTDNHTHVSTRVMGTFGYLAPEYASSGKLTEKSDVFSFGVMLLELIAGKRPVDPTQAMEDSLVDWARPLMSRALMEGIYEELVDIRLENEFNTQEMARMVACAAASIRHSARKRPKMSQVVRALEGDVSLDDLNEGIRPGQSSIYSATSSDYDSNAYHADMSKFRKIALSDDSSELAASSNDSREMNHPSPGTQRPLF